MLLRSIDKFARGFRQTIVVYPVGDQQSIHPICSSHPSVKQVLFHETENGHMHQNALKTQADLFSDAEFFLHMDADCVFTERATPEDYMTESKPDIVYTHYSELSHGHAGTPVPWQAITENSLGLPVEVETMRRFPFLYPSWLYKATRELIEKRHEMPFAKWVQVAPPIPPAWRGYSEFNALGCVAKYLYPEQFFFYDTKNGTKPAKVKQFWSHSGLTDAERQEIEGILAN
jgi:hypothetical protein